MQIQYHVLKHQHKVFYTIFFFKKNKYNFFVLGLDIIDQNIPGFNDDTLGMMVMVICLTKSKLNININKDKKKTFFKKV